MVQHPGSKKIREVASVLQKWEGPIFVAYSGGKDSSAVVKLVANALKSMRKPRTDIKFVYCDTGVENPIVANFVLHTLHRLSKELHSVGLSDCVKILRPRIDQRFFVRVIGRGYPPPTQFFRWCTKDLRIRPVQNYLRELGEKALVVLGTRRGESAQRDRSLAKKTNGRPYIQRQIEGGVNTHLYSPIVDFQLHDVWSVLCDLPFPESIDVTALANIYREGGGECPIVRETNDKPCASARFGCWTCTVVRRDRSSENMIEAGHTELKPYHEFRHWLAENRNDDSMRCARRRNGSKGLGPFTLEARKLLLKKIRALEVATGKQIVSIEEENEIRRLWKIDHQSDDYRKLESPL
jgi:DNA sulfur modification protein DndC